SASRVAIQPDGKILVAGGFTTSLALARYNTDGSLDSTFGNAGRVTDDVGFFSTPVPNALVVQTDRKILLLLGNSLKRYQPDGSADPTFRADRGRSTAANLAVQADGKIVVVGSRLQRLNPDGSPDPNFGNNGTASTDYTLSGVALQGDGKILVVGRQT